MVGKVDTGETGCCSKLLDNNSGPVGFEMENKINIASKSRLAVLQWFFARRIVRRNEGGFEWSNLLMNWTMGKEERRNKDLRSVSSGFFNLE